MQAYDGDNLCSRHRENNNNKICFQVDISLKKVKKKSEILEGYYIKMNA